MTLSGIRHEWDLCDKILRKSYAQVETSVAHVRQKSGGLKPKVRQQKTSHTYGIRLRAGELEKIQEKAKTAGCTTNSYIRASILGSDYKAPMSAALREILLKLNLELTAHGRNLNQIAKHLNAGLIGPDDGLSVLGAIRSPLVQALRAVKQALSQGLPQP